MVSTHLNTCTLIDSEDFQCGSPGSRGNTVIPDTARETFITLLQRNLEFQLLLVLWCHKLDIGESIAEIHGRAEDPVVHRDEGRVLIAVEVLERGASGFQNEKIGDSRGESRSQGLLSSRCVDLETG